MEILNSSGVFFASRAWVWFNGANFLNKEVGFNLKIFCLEILCLTLE